MEVSDFSSYQNRKFQQIVDVLSSLHGVNIDWNQPESELRAMYESYTNLRSMGLYESKSPSRDFVRVVLITEALRIYLYEIAPKRRKTTRRK
jgi:hypothetical protein